jgi:DNA-directed RNA polymerase specialized sigma24 family protein
MNESAFIEYVAARRPQLFRTACLICGDPHRAEDVVQDALTRLYAAWGRVERMDNIDGYVRSIIVNAHYSDRRRPWRRERPSEPATYHSSRGLRSRTPTRSGPRSGHFRRANAG